MEAQNQSPTAELDQLLDKWNREICYNLGADPIPTLTSIAEIFERETEAYLKLPIDPFDDRHPARAWPDCSLGLLLKTLFKNENFVSQLTSDYMTGTRSNFDLHVISCRLLLNILPGLDAQIVFIEADSLVRQLIGWAEKAEFPLHSYATGLLASAMQVPEISIIFRDQNNILAPLMLNRLSQLTHAASNPTDQSIDDIDPRDLIDVSETTPSYKIHIKPLNRNVEHTSTNFNPSDQVPRVSQPETGEPKPFFEHQDIPASIKRPRNEIDGHDEDNDVSLDIPPKLGKKGPLMQPNRSPIQNECSSSSWAEAFMSGSYQMHPLSVVMQQRFILQYLSALGEHQELLVHMFEHKALSYILHFIDARKNPDVRLAFDALKFLAAFLTHKKFALEFLDYGGLLKLLRVNRHGMASAGVSICLYYLAYNEDVLERICWKKEIAEKMVAYGLWLLEKSTDSSRAYAAIFFSLCFHFPILLKLFDRDNGLRKLLNMILMRGTIFIDEPINQALTDDELFSRRQTAKQVCITLKKYVRSHFVSETRKQTRMNTTNNDQESKPISISDDNLMDAIESHRQQNYPRFNWRAIDRLVQEDGINYLLTIISRICNEGVCFAGKSETVRSGLEIMVVCSLSPKIQQLLLRETIRTNLPYPVDTPAIGIIMMCAEPKSLDSECLKSSLNILINLACSAHAPRVAAPSLNASIDPTIDRVVTASGKKKNLSKNMIDLSNNLKKAIWANNGTLILPKLITVTSPLTEADAIRSLVCRVLCGLAREETIRQMMSKLPLFTDGHLQSLMKEPIIPEKRIEHSNFCKYCRELIQHVTGTEVATTSGVEPSLAEIKRRQIVAQTKIIYDKAEAYHLVHNFLNSEGYPDIAAAFYKAANLSAKPLKGCVGQPVTKTQPRSPPLNTINSHQSTYHHNNNHNNSSVNFNSGNSVNVTPDLSSSISITPQTPAINHTTRQVSVTSSQNTPAISNLRSNLTRTPNHSPFVHQSGNPKGHHLQKSTDQFSNLYKKLDEASNSTSITLDSIFTEYLRHQHSLCKNPVASCPPFQLLAPHRCPEPVNRLMAPRNIASRIIRRKIFPPRGGYNGAKYDRHYIYSKYRPVRQVRDAMELRHSSTCCSFSSAGNFLFVGTESGQLKAYNMKTGMVDANYECHTQPIGYIQASSDDNLVITTCPGAVTPHCIIWTFSDIFERKHRLENEHYVEFGKLPGSDRLISTSELHAKLWDTATGALLQKYEGYHRYTDNQATLNYDDTLVLNDGILWDVRRPNAIHKFAKFNEKINGIFHPNGTEIICNSQVWDSRNYRLLQTIPGFDQCQLRFNSMGDVIFSTIMDDGTEINTSEKNEYKTSFRTFDSSDYSTIATIDLKRTISDLAVSPGDDHLALIESAAGLRPFQEDYMELSICRLYEIGRPRYDAEEDDEDDEDDDADDDDNDENDELDDLDEDLEMEDEDEDGGVDDSDDDASDINVFDIDEFVRADVDSTHDNYDDDDYEDVGIESDEES